MGTKKVVFAVDDDPVQLKVYEGILSEKYDLRSVDSAAGAIRYLREHREVNVILLDIKMPNIDGILFLNDLRKIPSYMNIPIIIISGTADHVVHAEGKKNRTIAVLDKPVNPGVLINTIEEALAGTL